MAKQAYALDLGSSGGDSVRVRIPPSPPMNKLDDGYICMITWGYCGNTVGGDPFQHECILPFNHRLVKYHLCRCKEKYDDRTKESFGEA